MHLFDNRLSYIINYRTGSKVSIGTNTISSEEVPILNVGDAIRVVYIGDVLETNIVQLDTPNWGITFTAENVTPTEYDIAWTAEARMIPPEDTVIHYAEFTIN